MTEFAGLDVDIDSAALRKGVTGRGRSSSTSTELVRELGESDIASLAARRAPEPSPLQKVRDVHHWLARYIAEGKKDVEVAALTGYTPEHVRALKGAPAMKELIGFYRKNVEAAYADMHERLKVLGIQATSEMIERLATNPDALSDDTLLTLIKTTADRTGHGPAAKNLNVNLNVGMADRLERARERAQRAGEYSAAQRPPAASDRSNGQSGQVIDLEPLPPSLPAPGRDNPEGGAR